MKKLSNLYIYWKRNNNLSSSTQALILSMILLAGMLSGCANSKKEQQADSVAVDSSGSQSNRS